MGKIIYPYGGFTAQQIANRSTTGISNNAVISNTVDCTNISITNIKNVLSESSSSVGGLCTSTLASKWSWFGPRTWTLNTGVLVDSPKFPYMMGYFACYNHNAVSCGVSVDNATQTNEASSFNFYAYVSMGEINWAELTNAVEIVCKVKDAGTVVGTFYVQVDASNPNFISDGIVFSGNVTNPNKHTAFTVDVYFAGAGHIKICDVPNVTAQSFAVTITTVTPPATGYVGYITLGAGFLTDYPSAILNYTLSQSSVYDANESFTIKIDSVDIWGDGSEYLSGIVFKIYANKGGANTDTGYTIQPARQNVISRTGILPFTILSTDTVNFTIDY